MDKCQKCKKNSVEVVDAFGMSFLDRVIDKHILIPMCNCCNDILYSEKTNKIIMDVIHELEIKEKYHPIGHSFPRIQLREGCFYECHASPFYKGKYIIKCGNLYKIEKYGLSRFNIPYYNDKILFKRINPII
jgi:hypothetical protein